MPTLAMVPLINYPSKSDGFSLVEILVVLLIIGLIATMAVVAVGDFGQSKRLVNIAEQFKHQLEFAQEKAILESQLLGVKFDSHGYQILRFTGSKWAFIEHSRVFAKKKLSRACIINRGLFKKIHNTNHYPGSGWQHDPI